MFALAVAFLAWLSRTVEITPALGGGTPSTSPAWSIIWWFIPIAQFWKPYTVVRQVWERLATPERRGRGKLVVGWWLAFLGRVVLDRAAGNSAAGFVASWEPFETAAALWVWSSISSLVASILGFLVVRELQARADLRARALGFEAPLPSVVRPQSERPVAGESALDGTPVTGDRPASEAAGAESSLAASLRHLRQLRDEGLITAEEYARKRSEILDRL